MRSEFIYKICTKMEWNEFKNKKIWSGSEMDIKDGYIHFSEKNQLAQTLKRFYSNQKNLVIIKVKTNKLNKVIWERDSNGEMFPHLYSKLNIKYVVDDKIITGDQHLF